jgi:hypothetical protein
VGDFSSGAASVEDDIFIESIYIHELLSPRFETITFLPRQPPFLPSY